MPNKAQVEVLRPSLRAPFIIAAENLFVVSDLGSQMRWWPRKVLTIHTDKSPIGANFHDGYYLCVWIVRQKGRTRKFQPIDALKDRPHQAIRTSSKLCRAHISDTAKGEGRYGGPYLISTSWLHPPAHAGCDN